MIDGILNRATSTPFKAPSKPPIPIADRITTGIGIPAFAIIPAATLQTANCDPADMSTLPVRITRVIPMATIRAGAFCNARSRQLAVE